jgi:hypothetical protein
MVPRALASGFGSHLPAHPGSAGLCRDRVRPVRDQHPAPAFARTAVLISALFLISGLAAVSGTAGLIFATVMSVVGAIWIPAAAITTPARQPAMPGDLMPLSEASGSGAPGSLNWPWMFGETEPAGLQSAGADSVDMQQILRPGLPTSCR